MAASLSDGEFNRMQTQLLELRETNYELEDRCKKQEREFIALNEQFSILEKDYQKANQALNRSKKAKEFELLIHENESMQMKLQSQEEDFRLQNEALMNELGKLVSINETLEKEVSDAKSARHSKGIDETVSANLLDDNRRLQAHNAALQNSLSSCQKQHDEQIIVLRQTIAELKEQSNKQPSVQNDVDSTRDVDEADASMTDVTDSAAGNGSDGITAVVADNVAESMAEVVVTGDSLKQLNEFRLNLETEKEENRLLKEQLQAVEAKNRDDKKTLQTELERLNEKLKKKQESLLQLQEDKERLFRELSEKIQDIQTNKDNEITALRQQVTKFQQDLTIERQGRESEIERSKANVIVLEDQLKELREKIDSTSQANSSRLAEQLDRYEGQINHLKNQIFEKSNKIDDLNTQLQECQKSQSSTMDQLLAVQLDRDSQILSLQEANRLAEKRKSLLDQLAVKYQEDTDRHRDQIKVLTASHDGKVIELTEEVNRLKVAVVDLDDVKSQMEQLKPQISNLEGAKSWLERRLTEAEETLNQTKDQHSGQIHLMKEEHESEIKRISECNANQLQDLQSEILRLQTEKNSLNDTIKRLNQEIKDQVDDKVLHEKKGTTMLKDLKRQLQAERKRADKLQEKLQEFLSDSRSRQSVEELFHLADSGERPKFGDGSSVSSWSPSGLGRENSVLTQSPDEEVSYTSLRQENDELLKRLAGLQEQKWVLEEKVSHLESSNGAMVDDLLQKTAIIEHYSMDNRAGQTVTSPSNEKLTPLKRVVDFVIDKGDDGIKDMNRKLQRVLEETLTKNMHLQQNLEMMSKELEDMRKQTAV